MTTLVVIALLLSVVALTVAGVALEVALSRGKAKPVADRHTPQFTTTTPPVQRIHAMPKHTGRHSRELQNTDTHKLFTHPERKHR